MFVYRTYLLCMITAVPKKILYKDRDTLHVKVDMHVQSHNTEYSSTWCIIISNHFNNLNC